MDYIHSSSVVLEKTYLINNFENVAFSEIFSFTLTYLERMFWEYYIVSFKHDLRFFLTPITNQNIKSFVSATWKDVKGKWIRDLPTKSNALNFVILTEPHL
jgi:hypothetical protein